MVIEDRYPTSATQKVGETSNQFDETITSVLHTLESPVTQEAYWLGWIRPENTPTVMKHCHVNITELNVDFVPDSLQENYPCGYIRMATNGNVSNSTDTKAYLSDGVTYIENTNSKTSYFFNNIHPEYSGLIASNNSTINLTFYDFFTIGGTILGRGNNNIDTTTISFTGTVNGGVYGLMQFLNGEKEITFTKTVSGSTYTFKLTLNGDFASGFGIVTSEEDSSVAINMALVRVTLPPAYYRNGSSGGGLGAYFCAKIPWEDSDNEESGTWNVSLGNSNTIGYLRNDDWVWASERYRTGAKAHFDYDEFRNLSYSDGYLIDGNVFCYASLGSGGTPHYTNAYLLISPEELIKQISLYYRVCMPQIDSYSNYPVSYVNNVTYATDVTASNEFTATLKTGNLSDETFRNGLRYWQYSSIVNNNFSEDDVPPYSPPDPEPEQEETGDRVPNFERYFSGAYNFVTQYALTRDEIRGFGHILWTNWYSGGLITDMWKNFKLFFTTGATDTGSVDISTVLSFVVSLQLFPFKLDNSLMMDENGIKIGTGQYPLAVGTVKKLLSTIQYLDFGTITVPKLHSDYRDYSDVTITLNMPYVGTVELNAGDVVGKQLTCKYCVDLQSGDCVAYAYTKDSDGELYNIVQSVGQMGALIPITATNATRVRSQKIIDTMGYTNAVIGGSLGKVSEGLKNAAVAVATKNPESAEKTQQSFGVSSGASGLTTMGNLIAETASIASRPAIEAPIISGGSGMASFFQPKAPWLQIRKGIYPDISNYNHTVGKPSTRSDTLSEYVGTGFTMCNNVDVSGLSCHVDEKDAIRTLLETGVYL